MNQVKEYSYNLDENMLKLLGREFGAEEHVGRFCQAVAGKKKGEIEEIASGIFGEYGREWMRRTIQLGEEYVDRTYEVLQAIAEKTNSYRFGLIPQRFLEIAYLATQEFSSLPVLECNAHCLRYKIDECLIYKTQRQLCGDEIAELMPCRYACLNACRTLHDSLNIDATVEMPNSMSRDGYCQFVVRKP